MKLVRLFIFVLGLAVNEASRILVWIPTASISHQTVFRPWTQELARRGHEVVVITTDPAFPKGGTPPNLTEIDVHDLSYKKHIEGFMSTARGLKNDNIGLIKILFELNAQIIGAQANTTEVQKIIHGNKKFDLLIVEAYLRPLLALSHWFKAPMILAASLGATTANLEVIGAPSHPLYYPTPIQQRLFNRTLWEKVIEFYEYYKFEKMLYDIEETDHKEMEKVFGKDLPPFSELANNVDMLIVNAHPIFIGNHPVPPNVVYMWGLHTKLQKKLPEDMKSYLDNSKHGVIYTSFGTNTDPSQLSPGLLDVLMKVFCQLPYDVLFKWNKDELPGRCNNVKIGNWFPQSDLLRHPKIKAFVTQGGIQSAEEAIQAGVPLIGIPMLGDQWYNVDHYVRLKIGVKLDAENINEEQFKNAVMTVIEDGSYRRNIKKLDQLMKDEPMKPLERVVWWTEHVLRHGGARHLRAPAANVSWAQYFEIELILTLFSLLVISVLLVLLAIYSLIKFIFGLGNKAKVD